MSAPASYESPDVDELGSRVSQETMASFSAAWKAHAQSMDGVGKAFAKAAFEMHSKALQVRRKPVTACKKRAGRVLGS
jgi:hypothetical protein